MATKKQQYKRKRTKMRIRKKISGTPQKPRLSVFRSNKHIYGQLIDDANGRTLVAASSNEKDFQAEGNKTETASKVGQLIAQRAVEIGIQTIVFDRNGYIYHGRIKALADGARKNGLKF